MRFLFIALVNWKMPDALPFSDQPRPTGLAHWIDFSFLGQPGVFGWVRITLAVLSVPYVLGRWLPVVIPLITALHVAVFTFYNSQGYVNHTWQLISMILVAQ